MLYLPKPQFKSASHRWANSSYIRVCCSLQDSAPSYFLAYHGLEATRLAIELGLIAASDYCPPKLETAACSANVVNLAVTGFAWKRVRADRNRPKCARSVYSIASKTWVSCTIVMRQYDVGRRWFVAFFSSGVKVKMTVVHDWYITAGAKVLLLTGCSFGVFYRLICRPFRSRCICQRIKKVGHRKSFAFFLRTYARVSVAATNNKYCRELYIHVCVKSWSIYRY